MKCISPLSQACLPLETPRVAWPDMIDAAARILRDEDCGCAELADDLHGIANKLRSERERQPTGLAHPAQRTTGTSRALRAGGAA